MDLEIRSHGDFTHTLYVNGEPTVQRESFAVCDSVREALMHPDRWAPTEAYDVAGSIRAHYGFDPDDE